MFTKDKPLANLFTPYNASTVWNPAYIIAGFHEAYEMKQTRIS